MMFGFSVLYARTCRTRLAQAKKLESSFVKSATNSIMLQGAHLRGVFLKLTFHMVLYIFKCTCFRVTFQSIIVHRYITNEPV